MVLLGLRLSLVSRGCRPFALEVGQTRRDRSLRVVLSRMQLLLRRQNNVLAACTHVMLSLLLR